MATIPNYVHRQRTGVPLLRVTCTGSVPVYRLRVHRQQTGVPFVRATCTGNGPVYRSYVQMTGQKFVQSPIFQTLILISPSKFCFLQQICWNFFPLINNIRNNSIRLLPLLELPQLLPSSEFAREAHRPTQKIADEFDRKKNFKTVLLIFFPFLYGGNFQNPVKRYCSAHCP